MLNSDGSRESDALNRVSACRTVERPNTRDLIKRKFICQCASHTFVEMSTGAGIRLQAASRWPETLHSPADCDRSRIDPIDMRVPVWRRAHHSSPSWLPDPNSPTLSFATGRLLAIYGWANSKRWAGNDDS